MSARSGLVGKNPPGPIWGHLRPFFHGPNKIKNTCSKIIFSLGGPMGPIHPVWALAAIHPWWGSWWLTRNPSPPPQLTLRVPKIWGSFFGKKSACGNGRRVGLQTHGDHFSGRKNRLRQRSQTCGASQNVGSFFSTKMP